MEELKFEKMILSVFGFYPKRSKKFLTWSRVRQVVVLVGLLVHLGQVTLYVAHTSFTKATTYLVLPLEITHIMNFLIFFYYEKDVLEVEDMLLKPILSTYPKEYTFVRKKMTFINFFSKVNLFLIAFDETYYMFFEPSETEGRHLPNEVAVPCDLNGDFCFVVFYVLQVIFIYLYGILMTALDCMFCKWAMVCSCLFEILYFNLNHIDYENDKRAVERLKENVARHIAILT